MVYGAFGQPQRIEFRLAPRASCEADGSLSILCLDEPARAALECGIARLDVDEVWFDASLPGVRFVLVEPA